LVVLVEELIIIHGQSMPLFGVIAEFGLPFTDLNPISSFLYADPEQDNQIRLKAGIRESLHQFAPFDEKVILAEFHGFSAQDIVMVESPGEDERTFIGGTVIDN
jgi:hypothetical protein